MFFSQEVTANYGFMEKYLATEAGIQMMLTVGQAVAGIKDKGEFHRCYICFFFGVILFFPQGDEKDHRLCSGTS